MTVGNSARMQISMATAQAKYDDLYSSMFNSFSTSNKLNKYGINNTNATKTLDELLNSSALKNKSSEYREMYSSIYKNIFGISDDSSKDSDVASPQSIKTASASAGGAAQSIQNFAKNLDYNGELDTDTYRKYAQSFVDSYNAMIDKVGNSDNAQVLQKGVLMVNTAKVYTSSLKRAGITLGADNKMTLNDDLSKVDAVEVKSLFGKNSFADKVIQKASQINSLTGGNGIFTAGIFSSSSTSSASSQYTDNSSTLKELAPKVKDLAGAVEKYAKGLGTEDNTYSVDDYTNVVKDFIDSYNSFIDESSKSNNSAVRNRATTLTSSAQAYKYALQRAGINVDKNGKLSLADSATLNKLTDKDIKYSFGNGGFLQKVTDKANQVNSLVSSASAMGYGSNASAIYAYSSGALFSIYA